MKRKVYFRADGNAKMGLGHVIRSLALAEMLEDEFECHFIIRNPLPTLKVQILEVCKAIIELPETGNDNQEAQYLANDVLTGKEIVVLDGYHFRTEYQQLIKSAGCKVVCIDDIYAYHFVADVVINHAEGLCPALYSAEPYTRLLFGLSYSLLRKPFLDAARTPRSIITIKNILICFGGSDFNNVTLKILKALKKGDIKGIEDISVVLGSANQNKREIYAFVDNTPQLKINIFENQTADQMAGLMKKSHLAIVPASSVLYEVISVKMPAISGYYVDNQLNVYKSFKDLGLIYGVGDLNEFDGYVELLSKILQENPATIMDVQAKLQDGTSSEKLLKVFESLEMDMQLKLRKATAEDLMLFFQWANDVMVRQNAIITNPIQLDGHENWFATRLNDPATILYVFEIKEKPVGQVRFEVKAGSAIIDYSIDTEFRGMGLGEKILRKSIKCFLSDDHSEDIGQIEGVVKTTNVPSLKIFEKLGFHFEREMVIEGKSFKVFTLAVLKSQI